MESKVSVTASFDLMDIFDDWDRDKSDAYRRFMMDVGERLRHRMADRIAEVAVTQMCGDGRIDDVVNRIDVLVDDAILRMTGDGR